MRLLRTAPLASIVVALTGCITYVEHLRFNPDGSGTVTARLIVPNAVLADTFDAGPFRPGRLLTELSRDKLEGKLNLEGITARRIAIEETDSTRLWEIEYRFADLESFRKVRNEGRDVALRQYDSGTYELNLIFSSGGGGADGEPPEQASPSEEGEEGEVVEVTVSDSLLLTRLLPGFSATFTFDMPTSVISAPRGRVSGNTASFVWSFEREGIHVLEPKTMRVIFRKGNLNWPTFEALPSTEAEVGDWETSY